MSRLILLIVGILLTNFAKAQDWFPSGASWYYNQSIVGSGNTYRHLEVTGDTIIQGKNCKVITGVCQCSFYESENFLFEEGERIYIFSHQADSFRLLYDFNLLPGDTLIYRGDEGIEGDGYFLLDSITFFQAGSQQLRVQHITWLDGYLQYGNEIIERIGAVGCLYPVIWICDPGTAGLRCYEDSEIGLINFQVPEVPCDYISSTSNAERSNTLKVYPNPTSGILNFEADQEIKKIELFNSISVQNYEYPNIFKRYNEINIEFLSPGIYFLKVTTGDNQTIHKTIVLQN